LPSDDDKRLAQILVAKREGDTTHLRAALTDPLGRTLAARYLADLGCREATDDIARLLDASDPWVRVAAVRALGRLQAGVLVPRFREMAREDSSAAVRLWAIAAVGEAGGRSDREFLEELLSSPEWRTRRAAVYALGVLGDPAAVPALRRARRSDWSKVIVPFQSGSAYRRALNSLRAAAD
jgi:HEAT repeat protein